MTLPSSGRIGLKDVRTELWLTGRISFKDLYGKAVSTFDGNFVLTVGYNSSSNQSASSYRYGYDVGLSLNFGDLAPVTIDGVEITSLFGQRTVHSDGLIEYIIYLRFATVDLVGNRYRIEDEHGESHTVEVVEYK